MSDNIATLGLAFNSQTATKNIGKVVAGFIKICEQCEEAQRKITDLGNSGTLLKPLINELNNIPTNTGLGTLAKELKKFQPLSSLPIQPVKDFLGALSGVPNINPVDVNTIQSLGSALKNFKFINAKSVVAIKRFFQELNFVNPIHNDIINSVGGLGNAVSGFKTIRKGTIDSIERLFKLLPTAKPIPPATLNSIKNLKDLINAMNLNLNKTAPATKSASDGLGRMAVEANGLVKVWTALTQAMSVTVLARAVQSFQELAIQLAYIRSIALDIDIDKIKTGLENISPLLGSTAKNAEALYYAYSSGVRGTEQSLVDFTEIAAKTALLTRSETRPMVDAMTAAMNAYGVSASNASIVSNNLFKIIKFGKASGQQLSNSFGQVSPTARTLGVSLDELGASIASLTKVQPTRVAITSLNNMLSKMMKPTKESAKAMRDLGIDMSYSSIHAKGFANVMREVHDKLNGNVEALKNIFPDLRGQRAAMYLLGQGWNDFNEQLRNFADDSDAIGEAYEKLINDANVQLSMIPETIEKIKQKIGDITTQIITLGGTLTPLIRSFNEMSDSTKTLIASFTEIIAIVFAFRGAMLTLHTIQALEIKTAATLASANKGRYWLISDLIAGYKSLSKTGMRLNAMQLQNAKSMLTFAQGQKAAAQQALKLAKNTGNAAQIANAYTHAMSMAKMENAALNNVQKMTAITTSKFAGVLGALKVAVLKLATALKVVFSVATAIKVGVVAIFAILIDYTQAYFRKTEPITYKIVRGLYDWATGIDKVKEENEALNKESWGFANNKILSNIRTQNEEIKKSFGHIFDNLFKSEQKQTMYQYFEELHRNYAVALKNSKKYQKELDAETDHLKELILKRQRADYNQATKEEIEAIDNEIQASRETIQSLQNQADEYRGKLAEVGDSVKKFYNQWKEVFEGLQDSFDKTRFEVLLTEQEKMVETQKKFDNGLTEIAEAMDMADPEGLDKKTKDFLSNFKTLHKEYTKIIEDEEKAISEIAKIQNDFENSFLKTNSDVYAQAQKNYKDAWNRIMDEVSANLPEGETYDIDLLKNSLSELASEANKMLEINKRLGESERNARLQTVELVKSMNQLTTTSVDAVDAMSSNAMSLNSRVMLNMQLPEVQPVVKDNGEKKFRDEMKTATEAIKSVLDMDIANQQMNLDSLKTKFSEAQDKIKDAIKEGNTYLYQIQEKLGNIDVVQFPG